MGDKAQLLALAERCEAATGRDRELDDAIATALFEDKQRACIKGLTDEAGGMWMFRYPDGSIGSALRFTASIDAALTLVPEGFAVLLATSPNGSVCDVHSKPLGEEGEYPGHSRAATPALALCAASLRARAHG